MQYEIANEMWDELVNIYSGDTKGKNEQLHTYRIHYETLKMNEDEILGSFFLRMDDIVNIIKGLDDTN